MNIETPPDIISVPNIKTFEERITINHIFSDNDNWGDYMRKHKAELRGVEIREVYKMLHCQDPDNGYITFECPQCYETKTIHFNCNSRICTHCGKKYTDKWAWDLAKRLFDVPHRHVVMTMPDVLWHIFKENRNLLKVLMDSAINVIAEALSKKARKPIKPAFVVVLHTYGKDLKFNPHLHLLVAEGGFHNDKWMDINFLSYYTLRHSWKEELLINLKKHILDTGENRNLIEYCLDNYPDGFYVRAKDTIKGKKKISKYIGRYIRHPAVAECRITDYDGKTVIFYYDEKNEKGEFVKRHYVTMPVEEFIEAIIGHIPDNQFRTIRYYGGYWRNKKSRFKRIVDLETIYQKSLMDFIEISDKWAPNCPDCGCKMVLIDYKPKKPPPEYLFERRITDWCEDLSSVETISCL